MREVVSRETLRSLLLEHAENPSWLRYYELPEVIDGMMYLSLTEVQRSWFEADPGSFVMTTVPMGSPSQGTRTGIYTRFVRTPGDYDEWVVIHG